MKLSLECSGIRRKPVPGTWEVRVRVLPLEVTEKDRGQEKECGFNTKCTKWSLGCFEQDDNGVPVNRIDFKVNRDRSISHETR